MEHPGQFSVGTSTSRWSVFGRRQHKDRKDKSGFLLYRLRSGEAWVIYQLIDGNSALIPWPERTDGWEESLPSSFATYDPSLDALRITNLTAAMVFLGGHSRETRNTYDPLELLRM